MDKDSIEETILNIISSRITFNYNVQEDSKFEDLGFDSLDILEISMFIEDEFDLNIPVNDFKDMRRVSDLIDYVYSKVRNRR